MVLQGVGHRAPPVGRRGGVVHTALYHYGTNARVPGEGPYTVRVRIDPPTFMRHDPVNGKRYEQPVELVFADRRFKPGRKPSPDAAPRGEDAPDAGS